MTTKIPTAVIHPTSLKRPLSGFEGGGLFAGVGFVRMAWELAKVRSPLNYPMVGSPGERAFAKILPTGATAEYYRILDYAWSARWWPAGYRVRL